MQQTAYEKPSRRPQSSFSIVLAVFRVVAITPVAADAVMSIYVVEDKHRSRRTK